MIEIREYFLILTQCFFSLDDPLHRLNVSSPLLTCCRNDHPNNNLSQFSFIYPFVLLPAPSMSDANNYTAIENATLRVQEVSFDANNTTLKYLYFAPDNNADSLILSTEHSIRTKNLNFPMEITVQILSNGFYVSYGLDADRNISVRLDGSQCNIDHNGLEAGTALVTLSNCREGNSTLIVQFLTFNGRILESTLQLDFKGEFNVMLMTHRSVSDQIKTNENSTISVKPFETEADFYGAFANQLHLDKTILNQLHFLLVIEQSSTERILASIGHAYNLPILVFNLLTQSQQVHDDNTKYISIPQNSNLYSVLLDDLVQQNERIVLLRSEDVTYGEFFSIFRAKLELSKDIIVQESGRGLRNQLKAIQERSTIIVILDSHRASIVLREATRLGIVPANGYLWISYSAQYVVSNTFMRSACLESSPPCHMVFKDMWNIFHLEEWVDCEKDPTAYSPLVAPVTNLTALMYDHFVSVVFNDMRILTDALLKTANINDAAPDVDFFGNLSSFISCLPSGSGLKIVSKQVYDKENQPNLLCQPGWHGKTCSTPVCSSASCNQTHGTCIAPEVCKCRPGRHGRNCNGDCSRSCVNGVCNDGMYGDGTCSTCDWLYLGEYFLKDFIESIRFYME